MTVICPECGCIGYHLETCSQYVRSGTAGNYIPGFTWQEAPQSDRDSHLWELFVAAVTSAWNLTNNGYAWTDRPKDEIANAAMRNARAALAVWEARNEEAK